MVNNTSTMPNGSPSGGGSAFHSRFKPVDPLRVCRRYARVLVVTSIISLVLGIGIWAVLHLYMPRYTSFAQLTVADGLSNPYQNVKTSEDLKPAGMDILAMFIKNQIIRLRSDEVINAVLERDDIRNTAWFARFRDDGTDDVRAARRHLQAKLQAVQIKGSSLIELSLAGADKDDVPLILDTVIDVYLNKMEVSTIQESDDVRQAMVRERNRSEDDVKRLHKRLQLFVAERELPELEAQGNEATIAYQMLANQKASLDLALQSAREAYLSQSGTEEADLMPPTADELAQVEADPMISQQQQRLQGLREQRQVLVERLGARHRSVKELDLHVEAIEQDIRFQTDKRLRDARAVQHELSRKAVQSLEAQLQILQPQLERARARVMDLNNQLAEYKRIEVLAAEATQRRTEAEQFLTSIRIQTSRPDSIRVRRVLRATEAELTFPRPVLIIPGVFLIGLGSVTSGVFFKEVMDQRIRTPADAKLLRGCPLLGVMPRAHEDPQGRRTRMEAAVWDDASGLIAESFRQLRTAVMAKMLPRQHRTLLLVGAKARCGTSVVVSNLAASIACHGKRVLVIDANARQPSLHRLYQGRLDPGLVDVLRGTVSWESAVQHLQSPGLDFLPSGRTKDMTPEWLDGEAFRLMLDQVQQVYDTVVIDAPPALLTSEACLLSTQVDAIGLVVRADQDTRGMVERLIHQFEGRRAEVLGMILNGVSSNVGGYFRQNYREFYHYARNGTSHPPVTMPRRAQPLRVEPEPSPDG